MVYNESLSYLLYSCVNIIFTGKSGFWDMGQNYLGQSDCRIFKSIISLEKRDEKVWIFACWCKFIKIKSWLKYVGGGRGQRWQWPLCGHRILKLAVSGNIEYVASQDWILRKLSLRLVLLTSFRKCKERIIEILLISGILNHGNKTPCDKN